MAVSREVVKTCIANDAWSALNGVIVVFKPASTNINKVRSTLLTILCRDLNSMKVRPPSKRVVIAGETNKKLKVLVKTNFCDHPLAVGPRYKPDDFKLLWANTLSQDASGVLVGGLNEGTKMSFKIRQSNPTKFYKVKGIFGQATDNYFINGKIVEKSTFKHIKRNTIDRVCASMQSSHQKKMFELNGIDMQSQAAYELATKGLLRSTDKEIPMLYSIRCTDYNPPEFTLEIVCINEHEMYLKTVVHDIGMMLHSTATCTQLVCCQFGLFDLNSALLSKHWELDNILANIRFSDRILRKNESLLNQKSPTLELKEKPEKNIEE